jgi:hypothetical protein
VNAKVVRGHEEGNFCLFHSVATDPYTRCGLTRRLCISHLDRFLIHHLPNNYVGVLGAEGAQFRARLASLLAGAS